MAKAATKPATGGKPSPETSNAVATVSKTGGALADPALMQAWEGMGTGLENVKASDLLIPRLTIIQALSPQINPQKPEFDETAKAGMIYDVGLQEGFTSDVGFIFVHYVKQWLEWAPRNTGKGLQGVHDTAAILEKTTQDDKRRNKLDNGNYIMETMQFYGMNMNADMRKSFIPMASTQLKKGRRLLTLATNEKLIGGNGLPFTPPLFYRTYRLSTVPESNAEGNWMGWKIERSSALDELPNWQHLMAEIKDFRDAVSSGTVSGDIEAMAREVAENDGHTIDGEGGRM